MVRRRGPMGKARAKLLENVNADNEESLSERKKGHASERMERRSGERKKKEKIGGRMTCPGFCVIVAGKRRARARERKREIVCGG